MNTTNNIETFGLKYQERVERIDWRKGQSEESACCICGKQCPMGENQHWVYLSNMGDPIAEEEDGTQDGDDLAFHVIGSTCAKKVKRAGLPLYQGGPVAPGERWPIKRIQ